MEQCDMLKCNPICLRCGDTPSCGDGSWGWMDGVHRHRCRDSHPQCGHDRVPCEKHQPEELIALLRDEVKALRIVRDVKNAEVDRLTKERDVLRDEARMWREVDRLQAEENENGPEVVGMAEARYELHRAMTATDATGALKGVE